MPLRSNLGQANGWDADIVSFAAPAQKTFALAA